MIGEAAAVARGPRLPRVSAFARREWGLLTSGLVWLLFVVNFNRLDGPVNGDALVQYRFVERLFGDRSHALGYYFGLGIVEAPFYGIGKLLDQAGVHAVWGQPVRPAMVALGLGLLSLAVWPLLGLVLRGMQLGHRGFVLLAAALGTPFFFYATFLPGKNHVLDATAFTGVVYLSFRYFRSDPVERWLPFALGALFGCSYTIRYFSGAEAVMLVALLVLWRRYRHALEIAATSAVVFGLLFLVPMLMHVPVFGGGYDTGVLAFHPLNPLWMLFTNHRGYFVWSPVAFLAAIGLVLLFRRRPGHRRFLTAVTAMVLGVIASYTLVSFWDGTWSFSQRFFTSFLPLVAIGLAGLVDAVPRTAIAAATVCAAWSLFLAFNLVTIGGPQYLSTIPGGATDLALVPARTNTTVGAYLWGLWHKSNLFR